MVVLDEATAHLDSESEAAVQRALKTALAGRTSLVIAHRLSTIRDADQILVVDAGRVTERGSHEELLAADGLYAELYHTQFAAQERSVSPGGRRAPRCAPPPRRPRRHRPLAGHKAQTRWADNERFAAACVWCPPIVPSLAGPQGPGSLGGRAFGPPLAVASLNQRTPDRA